MKIMITGGAGFIGSSLVRFLADKKNIKVLNVDKLTYAGNLESLSKLENKENHIFFNIDINQQEKIQEILFDERPNFIMHLAAESHVDRSINGPRDFINTNILGTFSLLEASRNYYQNLSDDDKSTFKFHHISTDEVYGDLENTSDLFMETTPYQPSSPYSASKASSDHLVRAWYRTYGLPTLITNCSNNYGPYQFPEKLIPLVIINCLDGKKLPIYGDGSQIRDWLYVDDHAKALFKVVTEGNVGETYNIGGHNEVSNLKVVTTICDILDKLKPKAIGSYKDQITYVNDRLGHDQRYAIDASKIEKELNWTPDESFSTGLEKTIKWYLENDWWWTPLKDQT